MRIATLAHSGASRRVSRRRCHAIPDPSSSPERRATSNLGEAAKAAGVERADEPPDELQLGGADVLTYREMMERKAELLGRRRPRIVRVPDLTPRLSSCWVALVTPVEAGIARPLIDGLGSEMLVVDPPPPGINDAPLEFDDAVGAALA
jgi:broad specificity phosphatase PhoE